MYGGANYSSGGGEQQFLAPGYNYNAAGGDLGLEYRVDPKLRLGAVFGYSAPDVDLDVQNAHDQIDSYQFAGYGSFTDRNWFADALVTYGRDEYALDRQGVIDVIHGATAADVFSAAAQAGYLVDVGSFRAGPIAGLDYTHAVIHAYTESGDSLLTMMVGQQSVDDLIGDVGLELRSPFAWRGNFYSPFVNIAAERDFLGGGRTVTTTQVTTPLLPVLTPVPSNNRVYGKIAAGVAASLGGGVSATLNAATTFAREGGNDFSVGLRDRDRVLAMKSLATRPRRKAERRVREQPRSAHMSQGYSRRFWAQWRGPAPQHRRNRCRSRLPAEVSALPSASRPFRTCVTSAATEPATAEKSRAGSSIDPTPSLG